jgi:hypothetical protein
MKSISLSFNIRPPELPAKYFKVETDLPLTSAWQIRMRGAQWAANKADIAIILPCSPTLRTVEKSSDVDIATSVVEAQPMA